LQNVAEQKMADILQEIDIRGRSLKAESDRAETEQMERMAVQNSARATQSTKAQESQDVALARGQGEIEIAKYNGRQKALEVVERTTIDSERRLRETKVGCARDVTAAEAGKVASVFLAQARTAEAAAEGEAAKLSRGKRTFEQQLRLAEIDAAFAAKGRHVIAGNGGQAILHSFIDVRHKLEVEMQQPDAQLMAR
jgi:hypothetical protein